MPVARRKTASELKKAALQRKKRRFKRVDPKKSRAMKKAWRSKRTKMLKGVKTRKRLYQNSEEFISSFFGLLEGYAQNFSWQDISEEEDVIVYLSDNQKVTISLSVEEEGKLSVEVNGLMSGEVLEIFSLSFESSEIILKGVFEAYSKWESNNIDEASFDSVNETKVSITSIANFKKLPKEVQALIKSADSLESKGFQELIGYQGRKVIFSARVHWEKGKMVVHSIGGKLKKDKVIWKESESLDVIC